MYKYFRTTKPTLIARHAIVFAFVSVFLFFLARYITRKHNETVIYDNLRTIVVNEDIEIAIKKMKRNTLWLMYSIEECSDCRGSRNPIVEKCLYCDSSEDILEVVFHAKGSYREYDKNPRIYYNRKTKKVIDTDFGFKYVPAIF